MNGSWQRQKTVAICGMQMTDLCLLCIRNPIWCEGFPQKVVEVGIFDLPHEEITIECDFFKPKPEQMIACADCGVSDGGPLYRANAFGEEGVWLCETCHEKNRDADKPPIDPELKTLMDIVQVHKFRKNE